MLCCCVLAVSVCVLLGITDAFVFLQPLTVTTASLTMAENLADLIDGYCRLVSMETHSLIVRIHKGSESFHLNNQATEQSLRALQLLQAAVCRGSWNELKKSNLFSL